MVFFCSPISTAIMAYGSSPLIVPTQRTYRAERVKRIVWRSFAPVTVVTVTVTRGGSVGFVEIDGPARFEYRKAAPTDPDPVLSRGKVGATATVSRVD